jgi:acyl carrier protein phosphodiesterase
VQSLHHPVKAIFASLEFIFGFDLKRLQNYQIKLLGLVSPVIYIEFKLTNNVYIWRNYIFMNFLAHAHLSGDDDDILFGNFIADAVKGRNGLLKYSEQIQNGIKLHRSIDSYTDSHEIFRRSLSMIRGNFGKFSGIVVDIYYDHFLAKNWSDYHHTKLEDFAAHVYKVLQHRFIILPGRTKRLLPFLVTQNWLVGYGDFNDLRHVFYGMDRRTGFKSGMTRAVDVLEENYQNLYNDFWEYYPQLEAFSVEILGELLTGSDPTNTR